jgi:hypothetical protein
MDRIQKIIFISIISIATISWVLSKDQPDMMVAMMNYNPVAISLFTISWTIGMAAMMFPAITPMVLLYTRLIKRSNSSGDGDDDTVGKGTASSQYSIFVERGDDDAGKTIKGAKDHPYFQFSLVLLSLEGASSYVGCRFITCDDNVNCSVNSFEGICRCKSDRH